MGALHWSTNPSSNTLYTARTWGKHSWIDDRFFLPKHIPGGNFEFFVKSFRSQSVQIPAEVTFALGAQCETKRLLHVLVAQLCAKRGWRRGAVTGRGSLEGPPASPRLCRVVGLAWLTRCFAAWPGQKQSSLCGWFLKVESDEWGLDIKNVVQWWFKFFSKL